MFDLIIRGASIIDGTGRAAYTGDAAVSDGRIAAVGELGAAEAARVIEARGRCLTPGFIDIHRHADAAVFRPGWGRAELAQGLTTVINGNCGLSLAPVRGPFAGEILSYLSPIVGALPEGRDFPDMAGYLRAAAGAKLPFNTAMLAGMGTIRACAAGFSDAPLTDGQYREVHALLERCLADGAVGVSLGLGYAPECFYDTAGLIRALEPLRDSGTVVTVHMRQEGDGVVDALREMLAVARELRMPLEISHLKAIGRRNWRSAVPEMLQLIDAARQEGLDVMCDVYPYPAGSTQLIHVLPPEFQAGGTEALTAALSDPEQRARMRRRMETGSDFENISLLVGFENIRATSLHRPENLAFEGRSIAEIAAARGCDALRRALRPARLGALCGLDDRLHRGRGGHPRDTARALLGRHLGRDLPCERAAAPEGVRHLRPAHRALCARRGHAEPGRGGAQGHGPAGGALPPRGEGRHSPRRGRGPLPLRRREHPRA